MAMGIEVNTGTLKTDIGSIQGELGALKREISDLRDVAASLGNSWEGDAKNAFMSALSEDIGRLEQLVTDMEKHTDRTSAVRVSYEDCESTVAAVISGIKV